jgi:hypothetical protein
MFCTVKDLQKDTCSTCGLVVYYGLYGVKSPVDKYETNSICIKRSVEW